MARKKLTDANLKELLWSTANDVKTGKLDPKQGETIAKNAREIISIEKTKIQAIKAGLIGRSSDRDEQHLIG